MRRTNRFGRRSRRSLLTAVSVLSAAVALAACGGSSSSSNDPSSGGSSASSGPFTLNVGYIGTEGLLTGPEGFAYSKGMLQKWLKPAGVSSIKVAGFANGPLLTAAMTGGSIDIGVVGDTPALVAKSQGISAQLINQDLVGNGAWIVAQKNITSLSQLAGKTIAVQQASYIDRYMQGVFAQHGLTGKPKTVAMLQAQSIPAFEAGRLDAVALPAYEGYDVAAKGYKVLAKSATTPSLQGTSLTIATNKILSAHPTIAAAWNAARVKSIAYAKANLSAYYAYMSKAEGIPSVAETKQFLPISLYPIPNYTTAGIKQLQGTLNFLVSAKEAKPFSIQGWEHKQ
jgi:ABC-type nitrate/sulfonate/bicarbonate transport system substrate-binding protein